MLWMFISLTWSPLSINGGKVKVFSFGDTLVGVYGSSLWISYYRGNSWNLLYKGAGSVCCAKSYTLSKKSLFFASGTSIYEYAIPTSLISSTDIGYQILGIVSEEHPNPTSTPIYIFARTGARLDTIIVFKSTDDGATWSEASRIYVGDTTNYMTSVSKGNTLILGVYTTNATDSSIKVFVSNDGGSTWNLSITLPGTSGNYGYIYSMDATTSGRLIFTTLKRTFPPKGYLYLSLDGGMTWNPVDSSGNWGFAKFINDTLILGFLSISGSKDWVMFNINTDTFSVVDTLDIPLNYDLTPYGWVFGLASEGVKLAQDIFNPSTWNIVNSGLRAYSVLKNAISVSGNNVLIVDMAGNRLFKSSDNGLTWTKVYNPTYDPYTGFGGVSVEFFGANKGISSIPNTGAFSLISTSSDNGSTWTPLPYNLKLLVDVQGLNGDTLLAVGLDYIFGYSGILRSVDGGNSWVNTFGYALGFSFQTFAQRIIKSGPNVYLLRETPEAWISTDGGASFSSLPNPSPNDTIMAITSHGNGFYAIMVSPSFEGIRYYDGSTWNDIWTYAGAIYRDRFLCNISSNGSFLVATFLDGLTYKPMVYYRSLTSTFESIDTLPPYIVPIGLSLTSDNRIIVCSDENGCFISNPLVSVKENQAVENMRNVEIYDVSGRRVQRMKRGIYFIKEGGKVRKVIKR